MGVFIRISLGAFFMRKRHQFFPCRRNGRFSNPSNDARVSLSALLSMSCGALIRRSFKGRFDKVRKEWMGCSGPECFDGGWLAPRITWIGHATFLLQCAGFTVLTDPQFGDASFLFPRMTRPGLALEQLPPIDAILISHNHYDHLDEASLRFVINRNPGVKLYVPWGDKWWCERHGFNDVTECMWWDRCQLNKRNNKIFFTFLPAVHCSRRGLFDRNQSLWGSWMVTAGDRSIYFAGDTAYGKHFKAIAKEFPRIDVALMPISPNDPDETGQHVSAAQAVDAFIDLRAGTFVPMHWGVFNYGEADGLEPLSLLQKAWAKRRRMLDGRVLELMKIGQTVSTRPFIRPTEERLLARARRAMTMPVFIAER